ncbi:hypothetical protein I316_01457 [Kwoniella heveanensis BCC8398]|uniref:Uncharacterized protein n=1 Tax=Kwoniella heveanensis BCC8398 TaxID=1296120 RepID=A0A1B9H0S9_9TREE|nr:hypothetical protein I316_01457 [Kwoniella heveanensis BCC8398]
MKLPHKPTATYSRAEPSPSMEAGLLCASGASTPFSTPSTEAPEKPTTPPSLVNDVQAPQSDPEEVKDRAAKRTTSASTTTLLLGALVSK